MECKEGGGGGGGGAGGGGRGGGGGRVWPAVNLHLQKLWISSGNFQPLSP